MKQSNKKVNILYTNKIVYNRIDTKQFVYKKKSNFLYRTLPLSFFATQSPHKAKVKIYSNLHKKKPTGLAGGFLFV